jgi:hypothetical protein
MEVKMNKHRILIGLILSSVTFSESYASGRDDAEMKYLLQDQSHYSDQTLRHRKAVGKQAVPSQHPPMSRKSTLRLEEDQLIQTLNEYYKSKKQAITGPEVIASLIRIYMRAKNLDHTMDCARHTFEIPDDLIPLIVKVYFPDEETSPRKITDIVILDKDDKAGSS